MSVQRPIAQRGPVPVYGTRRWSVILVTITLLFPSLPLTGCRRSSVAKEEAASNVESTPPPRAETIQPVVAQPERGKELFARHCAACHGERGDGQGIAAPLLFPKPRNLRAGRFRLVSTDNSVPTREDLHAVLVRGMPGSSMPPWQHLPQEDREALVDEVQRLRHEGAREQYVTMLREEDGLTDEELAAEEVQEDIKQYVADVTTPGRSTEVPQIGPATPEAISHGREVYARFACIQCHGETGRGDGAAPMVDDEGMPTAPRDFTRGIFKGNHDEASLYRRIAYGMPGTPMPGSSTMTPEQMVDLVHYIRSLSTEEQRQRAILNRAVLVARLVDSIPESTNEESWASIEPVSLRMTPLWWRNDADPDLTVQAMHDGRDIAVRLSWKDDTADRHAAQSDAFTDAVAIQVYEGKSEPFLGMGDRANPVDVWFWNAALESGPEAFDRLHPNAVVAVFPFSEVGVTSVELDRPGARIADQPDISLPARAVSNQIVPRADGTSASTLQVGGVGSVTFRAPRSQIVRAYGTWQDGRWTVVMRRPLSVSSSNDGISLGRGKRASAAFAVWDGSHRDRDGQKLITIWQDLELE